MSAKSEAGKDPYQICEPPELPESSRKTADDPHFPMRPREDSHVLMWESATIFVASDTETYNSMFKHPKPSKYINLGFLVCISSAVPLSKSSLGEPITKAVLGYSS